MFSQMMDLPVGDGQVADLLLPPPHQPSHGVQGQHGALAGQQLPAADQEEQQQHLQPSLVTGQRDRSITNYYSIPSGKYKY